MQNRHPRHAPKVDSKSRLYLPSRAVAFKIVGGRRCGTGGERGNSRSGRATNPAAIAVGKLPRRCGVPGGWRRGSAEARAEENAEGGSDDGGEALEEIGDGTSDDGGKDARGERAPKMSPLKDRGATACNQPAPAGGTKGSEARGLGGELRCRRLEEAKPDGDVFLRSIACHSQWPLSMAGA